MAHPSSHGREAPDLVPTQARRLRIGRLPQDTAAPLGSASPPYTERFPAARPESS